MAEIVLNSHKELVELYKKGELAIGVNKQKAGDFVLSKFADPHNKPAHLFWSWTGVILFPVALVVLFTGRIWQAVGLFFLGSMVLSSSRKTAEEFVLQNMLEDPQFCDYAILWGGAVVTKSSGDHVVGFREEKKSNDKSI